MAFFDLVRSFFGPTLRPMALGVWTPVEHVPSAGAAQHLLLADHHFASLSIGITLAKVMVTACSDPTNFADVASFPIKNALQRPKMSRQARAAEDEVMLDHLRMAIGQPTSCIELLQIVASATPSLFTDDWIGSVWSELEPVDGCDTIQVMIHPLRDGSHVLVQIQAWMVTVFNTKRFPVANDSDLSELARIPLENPMGRVDMSREERTRDDEVICRELHKAIGWPTTVANLQKALDHLEATGL